MKTKRFPITVTEGGVSAKIRRISQFKKGKAYTIYIADFIRLGKRVQVGRASFEDSLQIAKDACRHTANGHHSAIEMTDIDRLAYMRAVEALNPVHTPIDTACHEYASALQILDGKASLAEACREWVKRNALSLPKITVQDAVQRLQQQAMTDGKSRDRQKQLCATLNRLAGSFGVHVHTITPGQISAYLAALPFRDRTKKNHRDTISFFNRWLILRGYLSKGTDWLENVQNYSKKKIGDIQIYTPDELKLMLSMADKRLKPFLAIGAFAGLRHAEINRLDWSEIELAEGTGDSFIEIRADKAKTQTRRLVPVKDNLKAWLLPHRKLTGKVCPFANTTKQLLKTASAAGVTWKHNGLRHSAISYRVSESSDIAKVSYESGNSPAVIQSNYLRRVKPALAEEWFNIMPT